MHKKAFDQNGKKVRVNGEGIPVKNLHAIKCLIAFAVVIILIIGLTVGAVFIVGDMAIKKLTDGKYGYHDIRVALNNIGDYREVEKNGLDNTYKASDADAFTGALKDALFLDNLSGKDVGDIIDAWADGLAESLKEGDKKDESDVKNAILEGGDEEDGDEEDADKVKNEKLDALLKELFRAENINTDRIAGYEEGADYSAVISDVSMAAFLNERVINTLFKNNNFKDAVEDMIATAVTESLGAIDSVDPTKIIDLKSFDYTDIIQIRQISFYKTGTGDNTKAGVKIVTQTNLKSFIDSLLKEVKGKNFLGEDANGMAKFGFDSLVFCAKSIIRSLLPEKVYLSVDIPVDGGQKPVILLNNSTPQDYENLMGILSEILGNKSENGEGFSDPLQKLFGEGSMIDNAIKSMNEITPVRDTIVVKGKSASIKLDLINLMLDITEINFVVDEDGNKHKKPEDECVASKEVYLLLKTMAAADTEAAMGQNPDYIQSSPESFGGGVFVYRAGNPDRERTVINAEYQSALMDAFRESYGLSEGIQSFDELFDIISGGDNDEFLRLFDSQKMQQITKGEANGITLDAKMLSALVSAQTEKFLSGSEGDSEGDFDMGSITPRYVSLFATEQDGVTHNIMEVGIEIDMAEMLAKMLPDDDGLLSVILRQIMEAIVPGSVLIRAEIDITKGGEGFEYLPSRFGLDVLEYEKTDKLLSLLDGFAGGSEGLSEVLSKMLSPVRDMFNKMAESLPGMEIGESDMLMPDVYSLLSSILETLEPDEVEQVLKGVYFDAEGNLWLDFNGGETADKDALLLEKTDAVNWSDYLTPGGLDYETELMTFSDAELAAMINGQLAQDDGYDGTLNSVIILAENDNSDDAADLRLWLNGFDNQNYDAADYMVIVIKLSFSKLGYSGSFDVFMPEEFYVTLLYRMDGLNPVFEWYRFNGMTAETQSTFYDFINVDGLEDILGNGEGNVGGGYFEGLVNTVLGAVDAAIAQKANAILVFFPTARLVYSYRSLNGSDTLGELVISITL